jgi:transposase
MRIKRDRALIGARLYAIEAWPPRNVLVVAMANKLAHIAWAVLSSGEEYRQLTLLPQ